MPRLLAVVLLSLSMAALNLAAAEPLRVGSKRFTESYILAQLIAQVAQTATPHNPVEVRAGLGNTAIVYAALQAGSIDCYPEYSGTIAQQILHLEGPVSLETLNAALRPLGLGAALPFGFSNGYALALRDERAAQLGIHQLSQLAGHPELRLGLSNEFIGRADGWVGLAKRYGLKQQPIGLDHGLAYQALAKNQVDAIDIYTTDARIGQLGLRVLADDAAYFPRYDALLLYRLDLPQKHPAAWAALQRLAGSIDEKTMIALNARAELRGVGFEQIAREHLAGSSSALASAGFAAKLLGPDLLPLTLQHLGLVLAGVGLGALVGLPLALLAAPRPWWRALLLGGGALMQTVPSLALLAVLIALLGRIGTLPALLALALYALLPILHNACAGLAGVPAGQRLAARALGLTPLQSLRHVELPQALPVILAGLRSATTIAVGTATIAAFIGAGGYGERIVTGLALNDAQLMLAGALPSAALALLFEGLFAGLTRLTAQSRA
ncbi:MAG TPA: glycine betaine ABC transporter substrate-binding protein [Burkholderiaceae bacterium]